VAKELMQCIADIEGLYESGEVTRAKRLAIASNCDLLHVLCLAAYCATQAPRISDESLQSFSWTEVLEALPDQANKELLGEYFQPRTFLINPKLNHLYSLLNSERLSDFAFLCTPLHWLFLLRFVLIERIGKLKAVQGAVSAWKNKHAGKSVSRLDHILQLEEVCAEEKKNTESVLSVLPKIKDIASALRKERDRINVLSPSPQRKTGFKAPSASSSGSN
jgi:hypothetical protein